MFHIKQQKLLLDLQLCFGPEQRHVLLIKYQKYGFLYIYCLQFCKYNNTLYGFFQINNFTKAELPRPNIDDKKKTLAKIIKKHIINRLFGSHDFNAFCITTAKNENT